MTITIEHPPKEYPYLAVWSLNQELDVDTVLMQDILLISLIEKDGEDSKVYVQHLLGGHIAYITSNEEEYKPLPKGYIVNICQ